MHKRVNLAIFLLVLLLFSCQKQVKKIGVSIALTKDLQFYGKPAYHAIKIAEDDINDYLEKVSCWQVEFTIQDNATNGEQALQTVKDLQKEGIDKFIIGSSGALEAVKNYADENDIVITSFMSTMPALAIEDNIFRLCPSDNYEAQSIVRYMQDKGYKTFATIRRDDNWGKGLYEACRYYFEKKGNYISHDVAYSTEADLRSSLEVLNSIVKNKIAEFGETHTCVLLLGFDEVVSILQEAADFPYLNRIKWLGSSANAHNYDILNTPKAAKFADKVKLVSPLFAVAQTQEKYELTKKIKKNYEHEVPSYSYIAYDTAWVTALADIIIKKDFAKNFPVYAADYFGITGNLQLDESGDRKKANFIYWQVKKMGSEYEFVAVSEYNAVSNEVSILNGEQQ